MNDIRTLAQPGQPGPSEAPAQAWRRLLSLTALRVIVATWGERIRVRREFEQKLKAAPHLIDDIGLTRAEAEAEIAKPFWR